MNTYDTSAGTHGTNPFWRSLRALVQRWIDRERELVALRNAVGMMAEARRADAAEWHAMYDGSKEARADALRFRWLAEDHADNAVRERVRSILQSMPTRSLSGARIDIDAAMG